MNKSILALLLVVVAISPKFDELKSNDIVCENVSIETQSDVSAIHDMPKPIKPKTS